MSEKIAPTPREVAIHAQLFRPNRHDRKRIKELEVGNGEEGRWFNSFAYGELPKGTENVRMVKKGSSRFSEEFVGWVTVGDYDWIWKLETPDGTAKSHPNMHFKDYSGSNKLNMAALDEDHITMHNPFQASIFREVTGSDEGNPFK